MKVLLDEMFSPDVARALRERGHNAVAVIERPHLVALDDVELFAAAQNEQRGVVTETSRTSSRSMRSTRADGKVH